MSEIGKAIDNEAIEARKAYIISYLHKMDITHHAGRDLEDMALHELEPVYIKEKNKEARAFSE
jgi:hypothetical protein